MSDKVKTEATEAPTETPEATPRTALRALAAAHRRIGALGLEPHHVAHEAIAALAVAILTHPGLSTATTTTLLCEKDPTLRAISSALRGYKP